MKLIFFFCLQYFIFCSFHTYSQPLHLSVFKVNVTPAIGIPLAYGSATSIADSLYATGIVLFPANQKPIVMCAVDWIGISNEGMDEWRNKLAIAAQTSGDRVSVHVLHQHDAVACDYTIEKILDKYGLGKKYFDDSFLHKMIDSVSTMVTASCKAPYIVTDIGFGQAKVNKIASNRWIYGADGNVAVMRWSSSTDSLAIASPEGVIDPYLKSVSFWNENKPIVVLTYYATHPQSYYGKGEVSSDFVGIARQERQYETGVAHIHFNGAGGNIGSGKYNDGSHNARYVLSRRMEDAMEQAFRNTKKIKVTANSITWQSISLSLPLAPNIIESDLNTILKNKKSTDADKYSAAEKLAWLMRCRDGKKIQISSMHIANVWLLNMPGELFVEYQLWAQKLKPLDHVCMAAYEEYGPGYIGTKNSYGKGGYEVTDLNSGTSPDVENILKSGVKQILNYKEQ